jgi:tetratricopeptide (TPR) repeat protein
MSTAETPKAKSPVKGPPKKKPGTGKRPPAPPSKGKKLGKKTIKTLMIAGIVFIAVIAAGTSFYFKSGAANESAEAEIEVEVPDNPIPESVQVLLDQGLLKDALDALGPAVNADPKNIELLIASARLHVKAGRVKGARKLAERVIEIDENRGIGHAILGYALFNNAQFEEALKKSLFAIQLDDKEGLGYLTVGKIYLRQKNLKDALTVLKQAARLDPKNPVIWTQLSSVYLKQKDFKRGLLAGNAALEANPDYPAAHFNLSVVYFRQKNIAKAIVHIEKAEALYRALADEHWVGKTRHQKKLYLEKFKIRPEDISKNNP